MAGRILPLVTNHYYHVFNRGVARQPTFTMKRDYEQALLSFNYYRFRRLSMRLSYFKLLSRERQQELLGEYERHAERLIEVVAYCLMPNHFHLLLRQVQDGGISTYLGNATNSYTRYFNTRHDRVGPLFQGAFKAVLIESDEQLIHVSRYIHLNPFVSALIPLKQVLTYPWSSIRSYLDIPSPMVSTQLVKQHFQSAEGYERFVLDHTQYAEGLEQIKHLVLEDT